MQDFRMETFLTVCRHMNFTKASQELNLTQPAVSQHIHWLEKYYDTKLFYYEGKKMYLTKSGEMLKNAATTMLHDELILKESVRKADEKTETLRFGATKTIAEVLMADAMKKYLDQNPESRIYMAVGNTKNLLEKLDNGDIDFAVVEGFFQKKEYEFLLYSAEQYIAVCSPEYSFEREPEKVEDLMRERLFLREPGSGTREVLERFLDFHNLNIGDFQRIAEVESLHTIKELTKAGYGITFLYETAVRDELKRGELRKLDLKDFRLSHEFAFIWRRGSIYAEVYRNLFALFRGERKNLDEGSDDICCR